MRDNNNGNGRIRIVDLIIMEMIEGIIDLTKIISDAKNAVTNNKDT